MEELDACGSRGARPNAHAAIAGIIRTYFPEVDRHAPKIQCPEELRPIFYHLGSDHTSDTSLFLHVQAYHSLSSLLTRGVLGRLTSIANLDEETKAQLSILQRDARDIYLMLVRVQNLMREDNAFAEHVVMLMQCVLSLYHKIVASSSAEGSMSVSIHSPNVLQADLPLAKQQAEICWYSRWPLLYTRPCYQAFEGKDGRSKDASVYRKCDNTLPLVGNGQRKFSPGLFKVTCPHGVVYGCHFLKEPESPSDFFTLLLTRWPRDHLPLVFYDNARKLHEYILNREPWMLQQMRTFVDSFHYGSWRTLPVHKCPTSFDTKARPIASLFNSQYEEHGNAYIGMHKRSARTMGLDRAKRLAEVVLQCWNGKQFELIHRNHVRLQHQYEYTCNNLGYSHVCLDESMENQHATEDDVV